MDKQLYFFWKLIYRLCQTQGPGVEQIEKEMKHICNLFSDIKLHFSGCWEPVEDGIEFVFRCLDEKNGSIFIQSALQSLLQIAALCCGTYIYGPLFIRDPERQAYRFESHKDISSEKAAIILVLDNRKEWEKNKPEIEQFAECGHKVLVLILSNEKVDFAGWSGITVCPLGGKLNIPMLFNIAFYNAHSEFFVFLLGFLPAQSQIETAQQILGAERQAAFIQFVNAKSLENKVLWNTTGDQISGVYCKALIEKIGPMDVLFSTEEYLACDYTERANACGYTWGIMPFEQDGLVRTVQPKGLISRDYEGLLCKYGKRKHKKLDIALVAGIFTEVSSFDGIAQMSVLCAENKELTRILCDLLRNSLNNVQISVKEFGQPVQGTGGCVIFATAIGRNHNFEEIILDIIQSQNPDYIVFYDENYLSNARLEMVLSDEPENTDDCSLFTIWHRKNMRAKIESYGYRTTLTRITDNLPSKIEHFISSCFSTNQDVITRNIMTSYYIYSCTKSKEQS